MNPTAPALQSPVVTAALLGETNTLLLAGFIAVAVYLVGVAVGRSLKRQGGLRLGTLYQLFCLALALYLPMKILDLNFVSGRFILRREIGAAVILLGALFVIALLRRYLWEGYFERRRQTPIPKFLREVAAVLVFVAALAIVLSVVYGQTVPGLLTGSGILAIILGLALQDLLGNMFSGLALEIGRPFKTGDWLILDKYHAEVIEVNWRSTRLRTNDDFYLDIPNNQIVRHTIINLSYPTRVHAMRLTIGLDYNVPPNTVKAVLYRAAVNAPGVLAYPPPKVFLLDFADSAILYEIKVSLDDHNLYNDIVDAIRTNCWYELRRQNIKIPYPIRSVQIDRSSNKSERATIPPEAWPELRKQRFFQLLSEEQTGHLLTSANLCSYGAGEKIIEEGAEGDSMFVLVKGTVHVYVARAGEPARVATLHPGEHFGETSLLTGEKRSATVVAETDCDVLEIEKNVFGELLQADKELAAELSELLAQRRLETEGVLASAASTPAVMARKTEYTASVLKRLYSFFEL